MWFKSFLFLFVFNFSLSFAQKEDQLPPLMKVDSLVAKGSMGKPVDSILNKNYSTDNTVFPKELSENFQRKYKSKDYDYTTTKPRESLWDKIKRRLSKIWESIFGKATYSVSNIEWILKIIGILILAAAVFFIARYLMGKDGNFFFSRKNKKVDINSSVLHENIHEINFPFTIAELENKKEFRSAIRYQFLFVLKKLSDQKTIQWNPEKTNTDYIAEISDYGQKIAYQKLSYIFENVWYGEQKIDAFLYDKLKEDFINSSSSKN